MGSQMCARLRSSLMGEFVTFSVGLRILEALGYHRPFEAPESAFFMTEGKIPGPKGFAFELLDSNALMSVDIFRRMLLEFGLDRAAVDAAIKRHT